jgi:general secretion pathway protein D
MNLKQAMTKVVPVSIGLILMLAAVTVSPAQTNPSEAAVNEAVLRQANTIVLRQKLDDAKVAVARGDLTAAARLYEDAYSLVQQIGSGIDVETAQTIEGLTSTRLQLARLAQEQGDLREANTQVNRVLVVDPQNPAALQLKKQNDKFMAQMRGKMPDEATLQQIPAIVNEKTDANTLVRDGKLLYEMGKFEEAETKLEQAVKLDPDNQGAFYYLNLVKQAAYSREEHYRTVDSESRLVQVAKAWESPVRNQNLPVPNPYASTNLIYTGPGREAIVNKLNLIHLDNVFYDGLPLSEVVRNLSEQSKLRDPEKKGINFLINPNEDNAPETVGTINGSNPGVPGGRGVPQPTATQIDPNTGLPITANANAEGEQVDVNSIVIKINPALNDVRLADALDAIVQVADHPIKYSIEDYAIVFSAKGPDQPQLFSRTFKVDPDTFYQGLQSVNAESFGGNSSSSGGSGGSGGGSSSSGGGNNQNSGAVVPVVVTAPGGASLLSTGSGGGGGGGGGAGGGQNGNGGINFVTVTNPTVNVSIAARNFFTTLGVDLTPPKSIFFNDRLGLLFVRATMQDLDTIENAIQALNEVAPQVHIKSRFIQVDQSDSAGLGFDWYLGAFNIGSSVQAQGGNAGTLNVPATGVNPSGTFPGNPTSGTTIANGVQSLTSGLNNSSLPAIGTLTGIMSNPNFQVVLHALEQRQGADELAEPEVTTISGRQTEMRATQITTVVTGFSANNSASTTAATTTGTTISNPNTTIEQAQTTPLEVGPVLDVVPDVLSDGYTINLTLIPSLTEFGGYSNPNSVPISAITVTGGTGGAGVALGPIVLPFFTVRQVVTTVNVWDNQTVVIGGLISSTISTEVDKVPVLGDIPLMGKLFQSQTKTSDKKNLMIFVTATIVDPAGNRVHSDDELPFAQNTIPAQPPGAGQVTETDRSVTMPVQ